MIRKCVNKEEKCYPMRRNIFSSKVNLTKQSSSISYCGCFGGLTCKKMNWTILSRIFFPVIFALVHTFYHSSRSYQKTAKAESFQLNVFTKRLTTWKGTRHFLFGAVGCLLCPLRTWQRVHFRTSVLKCMFSPFCFRARKLLKGISISTLPSFRYIQPDTCFQTMLMIQGYSVLRRGVTNIIIPNLFEGGNWCRVWNLPTPYNRPASYKVMYQSLANTVRSSANPVHFLNGVSDFHRHSGVHFAVTSPHYHIFSATSYLTIFIYCHTSPHGQP